MNDDQAAHQAAPESRVHAEHDRRLRDIIAWCKPRLGRPSDRALLDRHVAHADMLVKQ